MILFDRLLEFPRDGEGEGGGGGGAAGAAGAAAAATQQGQQQSSQPAGGEGKGAAAAAAQALAGQGGDTQPGGQGADTQAGGAGQPYYPEALSTDLRGANDRETIDRLFAALPKEAAPDKADAYTLELDDALAKRFPGLKDGSDPVLPIMREIALEAKLTNGQFNGMFQKMYSKLTEEGLLDEPIDGMAELEKLAPKVADQQRRITEGAQRTMAVVNWANGLANRGALTKSESQMLVAMAARAEGVVALEKVMRLTGEHGIQGGGSGNSGMGLYGWSDADRDMADERYSTTSPKHDPAFRKAADERMARLGPRQAGRR